MNAPPLYALQYDAIVRGALAEDLGRAGDVTSDAIVPAESLAVARVICRAGGRVAGLEAALHAFRVLAHDADIRVQAADGSDVGPGARLAEVRGPTRALLSAERTALNLLGRLCGIATATRDIVRRLEGLRAHVACTRKTTPGLRALEKYAVRVGGGASHRFGLDDAILIKDNHRAIAGGVTEAIARARAHAGHLVKIECEVDSLDELDEALRAGVDVVLLDNMSLGDLREAVRRAHGRALLEASGGITPETVKAVAETGVDVVSLGWLTHSAPALDVSLEIG
jgi:nicotinate-nucleotide pyrophosphorylase (carboxylating)